MDIAPGDLIRPEGALEYDLEIQRVSKELIVQGKLRIKFVFRCARCGDDFFRKIYVPDFYRTFPLASNSELINLTADVREDILLSLPIVAVCSAECRGLCSVCGVNLNRDKCKCRRPEKKNIWGVLNELHL